MVGRRRGGSALLPGTIDKIDAAGQALNRSNARLGKPLLVFVADGPNARGMSRDLLFPSF